MRIISHRGNVLGPGSNCERHHVEAALLEGYDVELDVRFHEGRLWIGHDEPLYELPREWVLPAVSSRLWFHAKDARAFDLLTRHGHRAFQHADEPFATVEPDGVRWLHPRDFHCLEDARGHVFLDVDGWKRTPPWVMGCVPHVAPFAVCTDWPREWR